MRKRLAQAFVAVAVLVAAVCGIYFGIKAGYPRPYLETVKASEIEPSLAYAVMKAESGFQEDAVSRAGAVGVMQLLPATAQFICKREGIEYEEARLKEGAYNAMLGCAYLKYLLGRFPVAETALAAYNAGEGTVFEWLKDENLSPDGLHLNKIPYAETAGYIKKVTKFRKIYEFYY